MTRYLYKPLSRPAAFAGLPKGWDYAEAPPDIAHKRRDIPMSGWVFGIIAYGRELTAGERQEHSLQYVGTQQIG
jgi:hypothetical protein